MEKILLMAPPLDVRGTTIYTLSLAREFRQRGYRVAVLAPGGIFLQDLERRKVPLIRSDVSGFYPRDLLYLKRIAARVREYGPEVIHVTHHALAGIGAALAARLEVPYVLTLQNPVVSVVPYRGPFLRCAVAISQTVREAAVNAGRLPRERVRVVENGVACDLQPPERRDGELIPVVGTVSYLDRAHGIKYFIHAARERIAAGARAHFLIVGTGPFERRIRRLIRSLSLERHMTLTASIQNFRTLVAPIDIFVSPILSEGFHLIVMQAMAQGIPVVASAAGGVFSLLSDGETGLIVPKKDVSLFAGKIRAYLDDREYAERLGRKGFQFVRENYPIQRMVDRTLEAYQEAGETAEAAR